MQKKKIVIVGGGYLGSGLAQSIETWADVTLIEQREGFVHTPAMIRALVNPDLVEQSIMPYDKLLKSGKVVRGRVTNIQSDGVLLENGDRVPADYIVVATGSNYALPFKPDGESADTVRQSSHHWHDALQSAKNICIVGAGAVGTELAGELAVGMDGKVITLISSDTELFPDFPKKLGSKLKAKLEDIGVTVILGTRATDLQSVTEPYSGQVTLSDSRTLQADIIFPVIGSKATSNLLENLPGSKLGLSGRIITDQWMRPSDLPNVFAAGDVADIGDNMTIVAATRQLPWLAKTLKAVSSGKQLEPLKPYKPWKKTPILLPLGPELGNSYLPYYVTGDFLTRTIKGKDLFLTRYNKMFGRG